MKIENSAESRNPKSVFEFSLETLIYGAILLLYFRPGNYVIGSSLYSLLSYAIAAAALAIIIYTIISSVNRLVLGSQKSYCPSIAVVMLALTFFWCTLGSSIINKALGNSVDFSSSVNAFSSTVGIILLSDIGFSRSPRKYAGIFAAVGSAMCFLNEVTMFLFGHSGGLNSGGVSSRGVSTDNFYLLAEDNATFYWTWPVLIMVWVYYYKYSGSSRIKKWAIAFTLFTIAAYMYVWSVMAMVGFLLTSILIFMYSRVRKGMNLPHLTKKHRFSLFDVSWLTAALFSYLMSVKLIFSYFADYIELYFNKSATLNGRQYIWETAIVYIRNAWLFGYGGESQLVSEAKLGINHTHNIILETAYRGGIIGIILFALALFLIGRRAAKVQDNALYKLLIAASFVFFMLCSVEFAFYRFPYLIIFVLMCQDKIFKIDTAAQLEYFVKVRPHRKRKVRFTL